MSGVKLIAGAAMVALTSAGLSAQAATDSTKKADSVSQQAATPVLPRVTVAGRVVSVPPRFEAAYKRAASGRGVYFTREEIQATNPPDLQTLMQRVPTVNMNARSIDFQKCQGGLPSPGAGGASLAQPAKVQIYIDGRKTSANDGESVLEVLQNIAPSEVQIMEVYNGSSRIPGEYSTDACAVILIWTRSY